MGAITRPGLFASDSTETLSPFNPEFLISPITETGSGCLHKKSITESGTEGMPAALRCCIICARDAAMLSRHNRMFLRCSERKAQNEYFIHFPRRHLSHHQSPFRGLAMIHLAMVHLRMLRLLCVPFQPRIWPSQLQLRLLLSLSQQ